jgi:hypothetical protein
MTSLSLRRRFMTMAVRGSTRDAFDPERRIEHIPFKWRGITMRIMYTPNAYGSPSTIYHFSRLEVEADHRVPLPITETGYKSQTQPGGTIEAAGGPVAYVERWLNQTAQTKEWRAIEAELRQGTLF